MMRTCGKFGGLLAANPTWTFIAWLALAMLAFGSVSGAGGAWYVQGLRIDALRAEYSAFVATTEAQGEAAKKAAETKAAADEKIRKESNATYEANITALTADVKRLRDARARSNFVPAGPPAAGNPNLACFDRAELERALQRLDNGVSGLLAEGDADAVGLNIARRWAAGIGSADNLP